MSESFLENAHTFDAAANNVLNLQALDLLAHDDLDFEPFGNSCTSSSITGGGPTNCCNN